MVGGLLGGGYMVLWEYRGSGLAFRSEFNPLVREVRKGASLLHFATCAISAPLIHVNTRPPRRR